MSLILDDYTRNVINSMNNMKSGFTQKRSRNFDREKESSKCQEYVEVFIMFYHFAESYLDKLGDE